MSKKDKKTFDAVFLHRSDLLQREPKGVYHEESLG